jgi:hypothetical protein
MLSLKNGQPKNYRLGTLSGTSNFSKLIGKSRKRYKSYDKGVCLQFEKNIGSRSI